MRVRGEERKCGERRESVGERERERRGEREWGESKRVAERRERWKGA